MYFRVYVKCVCWRMMNKKIINSVTMYTKYKIFATSSNILT